MIIIILRILLQFARESADGRFVFRLAVLIDQFIGIFLQ